MKNAVNLLLAAATTAIVLLAASSCYSAWVSSTNHHNSCARSDLILDVMHDILQLAATPPPDTKVSAGQVQRANAFLSAAYTRIDQARC